MNVNLKFIALLHIKFFFVALRYFKNMYLTRAGALAGVGLALDPEGNKSVLIQPSSFEKKYFKCYIFGFFSCRSSINHDF